MAVNTAGVEVLNKIVETVKAFGAPTASYTELTNLSGNAVYNRMSFSCTFDESITIRFGGSSGSEITIDENDIAVFDELYITGSVEFKHNGTPPSAGELKIRFW